MNKYLLNEDISKTVSKAPKLALIKYAKVKINSTTLPSLNSFPNKFKIVELKRLISTKVTSYWRKWKVKSCLVIIRSSKRA